MSEHIVIRSREKPAQLFLLFHGVGSDAANLGPLGQRIAAEFPQAAVVCILAPDACDLGQGRQWFSIRGITEENRPLRIHETMPRFVETVKGMQQRYGVAPEATALVGFSQGAIMALESVRSGHHLAGRVVALAGRFTCLPEQAPEHSTLHLIHGKNDAVVAYGHTVAAAERLIRLGGDVTADVLPFTGHEVSELMTETLLERLKGHIPQRLWASVQNEAPVLRPIG